MPCFTGGQMKALTNAQYLLYSQAETTFMRIRAYDAAVRAKRYAGVTGISYYCFKEGEQALYKLGQSLMIQNDPLNATNYYDIQKL